MPSSVKEMLAEGFVTVTNDLLHQSLAQPLRDAAISGRSFARMPTVSRLSSTASPKFE
jgi:hypothetical protein